MENQAVAGTTAQQDRRDLVPTGRNVDERDVVPRRECRDDRVEFPAQHPDAQLHDADQVGLRPRREDQEIGRHRCTHSYQFRSSPGAGQTHHSVTIPEA